MAQLAVRAGLQLASRHSDFADGSAGDSRGRPHLILVVGSSEPGVRATRSAAWLGRRLGAEMLVVAVVEYAPPRDELVAAWAASARRVVSATVGRLVRLGIAARGVVIVAREGDGPATVDNLAEQHETELVAVTARRRPWFWPSAGPAVARYLTRAGRTPVLVIPDHRPAAWMRFLPWRPGSGRGAARMPLGGR